MRGRVIHCVDAHAEGEPSRIIVGGVLDVPGATMLEKMQHLEREGDDLRRLLLFEPRGSAPLSLDLVLPSSHPEADAGFLIMESCSYEGMSGSNTINTATVLLETGMLPMTEPVTEIVLEAPAGLVRVRADCRDGRCERITFENVPSFATHLDARVEVPGIGELRVDVAYGGAFCAFVDAEALGFSIVPARRASSPTSASASARRSPSSWRSPTRPSPRSASSPSSSSPPRRATAATPATRPWSHPGAWTAARPARRPRPASPCSPPAG